MVIHQENGGLRKEIPSLDYVLQGLRVMQRKRKQRDYKGLGEDWGS